MKRKEYPLLLCLALLMGACAGKRNQADATSNVADTALMQQAADAEKGDSLPLQQDRPLIVNETPSSGKNQGDTVEITYIPPPECPVDQSAGWQIIEVLSKAYGDEPNVIGGFIGSGRCPSFLEGMYFDGATLVFQVRGDTIQARRTLERAAGSGAFRLVQMTKGNYSQQQLAELMEVMCRRMEHLDDEQLAANVSSYGIGLHHLEVNLILNTPETRRAFREKILDSPALRFNGPEQPEPNPMVGVTDTLGVSLRPEYSVYSTRSETASFILLNRSGHEVSCGDSYSITYEDKQGTWRTLPIHTAFNSVAYGIDPGGHHQITAHLCPKVHPNKPGRYRLLYNVSFGLHGKEFTMMTEFRLTDNEQEVKNAVQTVTADADSILSYIPVNTDRDDRYR